MPYLHADRQIIIELITVRTTAFVAANRVNASTVTTWRRIAFILVDTLIVIKVLHKAIRASAAVTAHKILQKLETHSSVSFCEKKASLNEGGSFLARMALGLGTETESINNEWSHYCIKVSSSL